MFPKYSVYQYNHKIEHIYKYKLTNYIEYEMKTVLDQSAYASSFYHEVEIVEIAIAIVSLS